MTGPATRLWPDGHRPAIEADDPPEFRRDYPELLAMARAMLDSRRTAFPERIRAGKISQEAADQELRLFEQIVAEWQFICIGAGQPAAPATLPQRRELLDTSLSTIAGIAARAGGFSESLQHQTQCVIALRWHLEPERQTIPLARITHTLRAECAARSAEPAYVAA